MTNLDEALERFQQRGLEYGGGLTNHGPMAAEALRAIGHPALIPGLVDVYEARLPPLALGSPIPEAEQEALIGDASRLADWIATFDALVTPESWRSALQRWLPRLLPGAFAAAFHALLRVAHGVRSLDGGPAGGAEDRIAPARDLSAEQLRVRVRELAFGLGYWAAEFQPLPGRPGARPEPGFGAEQVFAAVPFVADRVGAGMLTDAMRVLEKEEGPAFARAVERADLAAGSAEAWLGGIGRTAAHLYLAHPGARIAYVHAITGPSALRMLLPHLEGEAARRRAVGYVLQGSAALHACFGATGPGEALAEPDDELRRITGDPDEIRYRAACSLEEHSIKGTEACLREHALEPDALWLRAAADSALRIGQSRGGRGG